MTAPNTTTTTHNAVTSRPSRGFTQVSPVDAAVRMMSETAHDIRAPLATIRESVRLVHDGDMGVLSDDQRMCLAAAIDQCNCVDQMVGEMVQLERLRTGVPRVHREWIEVGEIQKSIAETLQPWSTPRSINVLWDTAAEANRRVFADPSMIRRLVVNLVINAIRETPEGGSVLVRVQTVRKQQAVQWSVVDQGRGISETQMYEIAQRQVSMGGGEGLGLSICRQLSALHFSPLKIESRVGTGTVVSFETVAGGPKAVAECWARWRIAQREPLRRPVNRDSKSVDMKADIRPPRKMRLDVPTVIIELQGEGTDPKVADRASAGTVTLGAASSLETADAFDEILQTQLGMFDLAYRVDSRQWVWVFDADVKQAEQQIDSLGETTKKKIPDIRLSWSDPQVVPLDQRRTASRLAEILIRQSLASSKIVIGDVDRVVPGTSQIQESDTVADRLDQELLRLASRLTTQTEKMHIQSRRLRPNF